MSRRKYFFWKKNLCIDNIMVLKFHFNKEIPTFQRSANVLVGKCPGQQMSWSAKFLSVSVGKCLGWQMSGSANVWAGKCLDQVSKCQIGKCLDRQMSVMVSICPMSNVGRKMSGPGNVRPYNVLLPNVLMATPYSPLLAFMLRCRGFATGRL